jgi:hypothetical protein
MAKNKQRLDMDKTWAVEEAKLKQEHKAETDRLNAIITTLRNAAVGTPTATPASVANDSRVREMMLTDKIRRDASLLDQMKKELEYNRIKLEKYYQTLQSHGIPIPHVPPPNTTASIPPSGSGSPSSSMTGSFILASPNTATAMASLPPAMPVPLTTSSSTLQGFPIGYGPPVGVPMGSAYPQAGSTIPVQYPPAAVPTGSGLSGWSSMHGGPATSSVSAYQQLPPNVSRQATYPSPQSPSPYPVPTPVGGGVPYANIQPTGHSIPTSTSSQQYNPAMPTASTTGARPPPPAAALPVAVASTPTPSVSSSSVDTGGAPMVPAVLSQVHGYCSSCEKAVPVKVGRRCNRLVS